MSDEHLSCVEIDPPGPARCAVIWLHGLGADGHDFEPIVPYLGVRGDLRVRFVFPHAPSRAVTINMGLIMPAWYDVREIDLRREQDEAGVRDSAEKVRALVEREHGRGTPYRRIVLAGFSQGGAIALHVGLRHEERLAGLVALSCYLVCEDTLESERSDANRGIPIFQAHGSFDPMVPIDRGAESHERLKGLGYAAEWRAYPVGHEVHPEEIQQVGAWLNRVLADEAPAGGGAAEST